MLKFNTKEQIVEALVNEFGEKKSSFYNTDTNKQREKYWTFNRTKNFYYKKKGNKKEAEQSWNEWYSKAKFKSNNRQALQKTDTFKLWYNRNGNDLNFRKKYYEQSI